MATPMKTDAPDAVQLLKQDHKEVRELLAKLEDAETGSERKALVERIEKEVQVHSPRSRRTRTSRCSSRPARSTVSSTR
jgi:hypothetical protein